jgi:hypothetical protein
MTRSPLPRCNTPRAYFPTVPNQPATQGRSIRFPDALWELVENEADDRVETATDVVLRAVTLYFRQKGQLPE